MRPRAAESCSWTSSYSQWASIARAMPPTGPMLVSSRRMSDHERPHLNSYWVRPGLLLAGEYPGAFDEAWARRKIRRMLEAGIRVFVDLTEEGELAPYDHL